MIIFGAILKTIYIYIILAILAIMLLVLSLYMLLRNKKTKDSFSSTYKVAKHRMVEVVINMDEGTVDRYYPYSQKKASKTIPLPQFLVRFDKMNADKLNIFLEYIAKSYKTELKKNQIEVAMYDIANKAHNYIVTLSKYDPEDKKYYLSFYDTGIKDGEVLSNVSIDKNLVDSKIITYINKEREISNKESYISLIKCKEYKYAMFAFNENDFTKINQKIKQKLENHLSENDKLISYVNGSYLLYSKGIKNLNEFKKHLRSLLLSSSGLIELNGGKRIYLLSLVAGYDNINKNVVFSETNLKLIELATSKVLKDTISFNLIQPVDDIIRDDYSKAYAKVEAIEKLIDSNNIDCVYQPIIDVKTKKISKYIYRLANINNNQISETELFTILRNHNELGIYFDKIIANFKEENKPIIFNIDYIDLNVFLDCFEKSKYDKKKIYLAIDILSERIGNNDYRNINNIFKKYKSNDKISLGVCIRKIKKSRFYDETLENANFILLAGEAIKNMLTDHSNYLYGEFYSNLARKDNKEIIAYNCDNLPIYEMLYNLNVKEIGGEIWANKIDNGKVESKILLKSIGEIENRN